ncbi:hypothetical protein RhiirA1_543535 [Rhizophagus irregularis]|uniref:Uncharacterized protein n=1 Tax=Rhizophagus irregularis TaxID=588596 RepID=A0A2N0QML3_9GLOM|nr:hypothetical protein RhiirA1_543535 [Rhizophagus irregularis]
MGRLSRLSSDVSALTLHFGSVSVSASTFQFKSPTRAFGYAATGQKQDSTDSPSSIDNGYVDNYMMMKLPSDDDSEDNSMVKSYQKNLDCIFQGKFYGMIV